MSLAIAVKKTANRKVGNVAVTHASQASCPPDCCFLGSGCYAESGPQGWVTKRLNKAALGATPVEVAHAEAAEIRKLTGKLPLRLHVVGDCPDAESARIVSAAADEYREKHGQPVWTYTHAWRTVPREAWGKVSVLASCETPVDVEIAKERGYATAIVVPEFPSKKRFQFASVDAIPCVEQTKGVQCDECRLCFNDDYLRASSRTIAFKGHGIMSLVFKALKGRNT